VNPAVGVTQPRLPVREMRFLDVIGLEQLVDEMPMERDRTLGLVLGWVGLRVGEALALERGDVDILRRRIRVTRAVVEVGGRTVVGSPKTHQARTVALPTFVAEALGAWMSSAPTSGPCSRAKAAVTSTRRTGNAGCSTGRESRGPYSPALRVHDLRHTAASLAVASSATVKAVQRQLGHLSATVTLDRYAHLWPDELDTLSEALDELKLGPPADFSRTVPSVGAVVHLRQAP
jgi:integrase